MRSIKALACALMALMLFAGAPAQATVTDTLVGSASCVSTATSCTANITASIPVGSFLVVVADIHTTSGSSTFTIADNATTTNCGGSYSQPPGTPVASNNGSIILGICASTTTAMTSGATCGSGSTQCAITVTTSASSYWWDMQIHLISGVSAADKVGAQATGAWTSGTPASFAVTPSRSYTTEYAMGIIAVGVGNAADSMASYTGGFTLVSTTTGSQTGKPGLYTSGQTITSGTPTLGATPTSSASRNWNSVVLFLQVTGAKSLITGFRNMMGVGL